MKAPDVNIAVNIWLSRKIDWKHINDDIIPVLYRKVSRNEAFRNKKIKILKNGVRIVLTNFESFFQCQ